MEGLHRPHLYAGPKRKTDWRLTVAHSVNLLPHFVHAHPVERFELEEYACLFLLFSNFLSVEFMVYCCKFKK
jgi:hypothetical protein